MPPKTLAAAYDAKMDALARIHGHIGRLIVSHKENRKASETHGDKEPSDQPIEKGEAPALDHHESDMHTEAVPEGAEEMSDQTAPFVNPLDAMMGPTKRGPAKHGYLAPHQMPPKAPKK